MKREEGSLPRAISPAGEPLRDTPIQPSATLGTLELLSQDPLFARADRAIEEAQRLRAESRRSLAAAYATSARVGAAAMTLRQTLEARQRQHEGCAPPDDGTPTAPAK